MSRRRHAWICWGLIAGSLLAMATVGHVAIARFERLVAKIGYTIPTPERSTPPAALIAVSCGVVALFLTVSLSQRGRAWLRMRPRLSQPSVHGDTYLEAFTLRIGVASLGTTAAWLSGWTPLFYLGMVGSLLAVLYAFARCRSILVPLAEWGWQRGRGVWREISIGVLVGLFFTPMRYLPDAVFERVDASLPLLSMSPLNVLRIVVWASIVEETLYRGMLYRYLRDRWQWPVAVLTSAGVFAAIHFPPSRWPHVFASGIVYALLREWRGSLLAPIAAHATGNLLALFLSGALP